MGRNEITTSDIIGPIPPFFAIDNQAVSASASPAINGHGFTGGAQAGYNYQIEHWVSGVELDFEHLGVKRSQGGTFPFPSTLPGGPVGPPTSFFSVATNYSTDWVFTARLREGWALNNWLYYVTGGLAVGRETFTQVITLLPPFISTNSFSTTKAGWTLGGGIEYALNRNWSIKAEYLYIDLGTKFNPGVLAPPCGGACTERQLDASDGRHRPRRHQLPLVIVGGSSPSAALASLPPTRPAALEPGQW